MFENCIRKLRYIFIKNSMKKMFLCILVRCPIYFLFYQCRGGKSAFLQLCPIEVGSFPYSPTLLSSYQSSCEFQKNQFSTKISSTPFPHERKNMQNLNTCVALFVATPLGIFMVVLYALVTTLVLASGVVACLVIFYKQAGSRKKIEFD